MTGVVSSIVGNKTIGVLVFRTVVAPKYKKRFKKFSKCIVHDAESKYNVGDVVFFMECKSISKSKSWITVNNLH